MKKELIKSLSAEFESFANFTEQGVEFWFARDLQQLLDYKDWRNFLLVINKAETSCKNAGQKSKDHFVDVNKMVDDRGFAIIRSKGDKALFGGYTTGEMKQRLGVPQNRPLADFLPTITIKAKDFANEITVFNVRKNPALQTIRDFSQEHIKNNLGVRKLLKERGIKPEELPPDEDIQKLRRRLSSEDKKLAKNTRRLKDDKTE